MTEEEWMACDEQMWLACDERDLLTYFIAEQMSHRKLRLAMVAVCRRVQHHLIDERSRNALAVSEAYADGLASDEVLLEARIEAKIAFDSVAPQHGSQWNEIYHAALSACFATDGESQLRLQIEMIDVVLFADYPPRPPEVRAAHFADANLVRDVYGNPFRHIIADPAWLTPTVQSIAAAIYQDRAFDRLPILADALEDAGCTNADVLLHCRQPGEHVRGCWVVDLVLGKA